MPVYIAMVSGCYIVCRAWSVPNLTSLALSNKLVRFGVCFLGVFGFGILSAAVEALPILESLKYVTRETLIYEFFSSYSFQFNLLPILLIPYYWGTQASNLLYPVDYFGYWNLTEMASYMGILPVLSAASAFLLLRKKRSWVWFWTIAAAVGFVLVLGDSTPMYRLMYHVLVYNMFRVSTRNWLGVNFACSVVFNVNNV